MTNAFEAMRAQDRRAVTWGAIAIVLATGYAGVVRPALDRLANDARALTEQQGLLARERALLAIAPALPGAQRAVEQQLAAEMPRLFAGDSVAATAELTAFAAQVATAAGVTLTNMEGRPPRSDHGVVQLRVDLRGEGSWRQSLAFIRSLESSEQLVSVRSVRLERGPRGGPLGGDAVTMSATVAGNAMGGR